LDEDVMGYGDTVVFVCRQEVFFPGCGPMPFYPRLRTGSQEITWTEVRILAGYQTDRIQDLGRLRKNLIDAESMREIFRTALKSEAPKDAQKASQQGRRQVETGSVPSGVR
jgi:hypothetical protein